MRTKGVYLSVTVGGTLDSGQLCAAAARLRGLVREPAALCPAPGRKRGAGNGKGGGHGKS